MANLEKGLIGHWTLNDEDTDGSTIRDRSAYDNHGTLNGGVTTGNVSPVGDSYSFDGSNGTYINVGPDLLMDSAPVSILCWVNLNSGYSGGEMCPLGNYDGNGIIFRSRPNSGDDLELWFGGNSHSTSSNTLTERDEWVHIGATLDQSGNIDYYKNGSKLETVSTGDTINANGKDFRIGSRDASGTRSDMDGDISDLRVYNRVLSQSEVNQLYNFRGNSRKSQTTVVAGDSLQAWYPFLQSGAADKSGNGNDGTVNGATYNGSGGPNGLGGYDFNGDYIEAPLSIDQDNTGQDYTVSAWFNSNDVTQNSQGIIGQDDGGFDFFIELSRDSNGELMVATGSDTRIKSSGTISSNEWNNIVVVLRGSDILYSLNGEPLKDTGVNRSNYGSGQESVLAIGSISVDSGEDFNGEISDVRIYDKALSQSEINQLYDPKSVNLDRGLVGHWSMDDSDVSGGTLYDRSAYGHHGNISGPTTGKNSIIGNSFEFDGSNDTVIIGTDSTLQNQKITAAGWAKADSWGSRNEVFNWDGGGFHLVTVNSGVPRFWLNLDGNWDYVDGPSSVSTNTWHMFTGTWDGNEQAIWLNGEKLNSRTDRSGTIPYPTSGDRLSIGGYDSNSNVFDGLISNVRLYKRKLTEKEINALYNKRTTSSQDSGFTKEGFEDGSISALENGNWTVGSATISSSRSYEGTYSFGRWGGGSVDARWNVFPHGSRQISEFEYYWKEDNSQTGHQVRLYDSSENIVQRSETENPQWQLSDGSNNMDTLASPGYNNWTLFRFEFDWAAGTYDYYLEDTIGTLETGTRDLVRSTNVSYIDFVGTNGKYCRFDQIKVTY